MRKMKISLGGALLVLAVVLLCAGPAPVMAQTTTEPPETGVTDPPPTESPAGDQAEPPETEAPSTANPPTYIGELLKAGDLTQEQVDQMRTAGYGWGEIRLATLLARQIVAANTDGTLTFADALKQVTDARAAGKGFGQIAADNNLKIGGLVGKRNAAGNAQKGSAAPKGNKVQAQIQAENVDGDEEVGPDPAHPPAFITKLVENQVVTQEQVNTMLASGYGWGEVRIATLLSQELANNSGGTLTFADALKQVMDARAAGKGFGQIAAENNLKIGDLVRHQKAGDATTGKGKKLGFFARIGRALGFGRSADRTETTATMVKSQASAKSMKGDKPERAMKAERPERPEKPAQPDRPERPERLSRPDRPERPERGPNR
ncbi:MAG: hypothetical protein M1376_11680 [Planctomycetes bacterium]|nr:hypothetical protein [Planctomycetota bacterium]